MSSIEKNVHPLHFFPHVHSTITVFMLCLNIFKSLTLQEVISSAFKAVFHGRKERGELFICKV